MNAEGPISPQVLVELFFSFQNLLTRFAFDFPQSIVEGKQGPLEREPGAFVWCIFDSSISALRDFTGATPIDTGGCNDG
jgi:hypothetical protein